jgi:hypothetical protein
LRFLIPVNFVVRANTDAPMRAQERSMDAFCSASIGLSAWISRPGGAMVRRFEALSRQQLCLTLHQLSCFLERLIECAGRNMMIDCIDPLAGAWHGVPQASKESEI